MSCIKENKTKKPKFVFTAKSIKFTLSSTLRCTCTSVGGAEGAVFFDIIDDVLLLKFEY